MEMITLLVSCYHPISSLYSQVHGSMHVKDRWSDAQMDPGRCGPDHAGGLETRKTTVVDDRLDDEY